MLARWLQSLASSATPVLTLPFVAIADRSPFRLEARRVLLLVHLQMYAALLTLHSLLCLTAD
jgi:hypothetical protein